MVQIKNTKLVWLYRNLILVHEMFNMDWEVCHHCYDTWNTWPQSRQRGERTSGHVAGCQSLAWGDMISTFIASLRTWACGPNLTRNRAGEKTLLGDQALTCSSWWLIVHPFSDLFKKRKRKSNSKTTLCKGLLLDYEWLQISLILVRNILRPLYLL